MGVIINICCKFFNRDTYGCKKQSKTLGMFEKQCVLIKNPNVKCLIQEEYPEPPLYKPYVKE